MATKAEAEKAEELTRAYFEGTGEGVSPGLRQVVYDIILWVVLEEGLAE